MNIHELRAYADLAAELRKNSRFILASGEYLSVLKDHFDPSERAISALTKATTKTAHRSKEIRVQLQQKRKEVEETLAAISAPFDKSVCLMHFRDGLGIDEIALLLYMEKDDIQGVISRSIRQCPTLREIVIIPSNIEK